MILHNLLRPTIVLLSCVGIASGRGYDSYALSGLKRLLLERVLASPSKLPDCPGDTVNMFYDLNFTIEEAFDEALNDTEIYCPDDEENCTDYVGNCTEDDFINIGLLLEKIVEEVEKEYPRYRNEYVDTTVCVVPYVSFHDDGWHETATNETATEEPPLLPEATNSTGTTNETATEEPPLLTNGTGTNKTKDVTVVNQEQELPPWIDGQRDLATTTTTATATKKRRRYTYASGGRCRACKSDNTDRRVLAEPAKTDPPISQKEAVMQACSDAETAKLASGVAQRGFESCDKVVAEVGELALRYSNVTLAEAFVRNVTEMRETSKDLEFKARQAMQKSVGFCKLATGAANNPKLYKQITHYMTQADTGSQIAIAAAKEIHAVVQNMTNTKLELKKLVLKQNFDIQRKELDDLIRIERSNKDMMEKEMDDQIQSAEEQLKLTQDNVTKNQLEENLEMLERMRWEKNEKFERMEKDIQKMQGVYEERLNYQIEEANILLAMEGATSVSVWLLNFADLLEHTIPDRLFNVYNSNTTKPPGCLTAAPKVTVKIVEKESWAATFKSKCEVLFD